MDQHVHDDHATDTTVSRPVTERSRITGRVRSREVAPSATPALTNRALDWAPITASVVVGLAITATLVILGIATGLVAGSGDTDVDGALGILSGVGAWAVVAAIIGSFAGSVLGGRLARWLDRGSLSYHALTSWGVATLLSIVMVCVIAIAFASTATSAATTTAAADQVTGGEATTDADAEARANAAADPAAGTTAQQADTNAEQTTENTADALGGAGLALTVAMLLTLVASFGGWWIGSRKRLTDFEREDADGRVVAA